MSIQSQHGNQLTYHACGSVYPSSRLPLRTAILSPRISLPIRWLSWLQLCLRYLSQARRDWLRGINLLQIARLLPTLVVQGLRTGCRIGDRFHHRTGYLHQMSERIDMGRPMLQYHCQLNPAVHTSPPLGYNNLHKTPME